jgi:hypothetical protein
MMDWAYWELPSAPTVATPLPPDPGPAIVTLPGSLIPPPPTGGGGGPPPPDPDKERKDRCKKAQQEFAEKSCDAKRPRPTNNFDINFTLPGSAPELIFISANAFDFLRGNVLAFQQSVFDDLGGNAWYNYSNYLAPMMQQCEANASIFRGNGGVGFCQFTVNNYFGGSTGGLAAFESSRAAADARSSRDGQVCQNIAAKIAQDRCNQ